MRVVQLSLTLLLLLLVSPRHADGYALSVDSDEAAYHLEKMDGNILSETGEDEAYESNETDCTTDNNTSSTSLSTLTDICNTSTTFSTTIDTNTDSTNSPSAITDTTPSEITSSTTDAITTTSETTSDTETISSSSTSPPPPPGLSLLEDTFVELNRITYTLDDFNTLVSSDSAPSPAASAPAGGRGGHPVGWWKLARQTRPLEEIINFCVDDENIDIDLCTSLYNQLKTIDSLMEILKNNVDDWTQSDQEELKSERQDLDITYINASSNADAFTKSVDTEKFKNQTSLVQQDVRSATTNVEARIADLTQDSDSGSGSVILVSVIGSLGFLMVVAIISVMVYGAVKRRKTKKKLTSAPYNKLQGEKIPIDGFLSDGPGSRQASRMDPYSRPVPSSVQRDPHATPYDHRSESNYSGPPVTRTGQGLPRTHF